MDELLTMKLRLARQAEESYRHLRERFTWDDEGIAQAEKRLTRVVDELVGAIRERYPRYRRPAGDTGERLTELAAFLAADGERCGECGAGALWVRRTQFSGDHYFCDEDAEREEDFGQEDPSYFVWEMLRERTADEREARIRRIGARRFRGLSPSGEVGPGETVICEGCRRLLPEGTRIGGVVDVETNRTYLVHSDCPNPPERRIAGG